MQKPVEPCLSAPHSAPGSRLPLRMRVAMIPMRFRLFVTVLATLILLLAAVSVHNGVSAQVPAPNSGTSAGEWRTYGGDLASTRYAALDQINRDNFGKLEVAWRFKTDAFGPRPEINFEGTPLMA